MSTKGKSRKISDTVVKNIMEDFASTESTDKELAEKYGVSYSYVNRLRNSEKKKLEDGKTTTNKAPVKVTKPKTTTKSKTTSNKKEFTVIDNTKDVTEIELLEMRIAASEQNLKWLKELLKFKKANK